MLSGYIYMKSFTSIDWLHQVWTIFVPKIVLQDAKKQTVCNGLGYTCLADFVHPWKLKRLGGTYFSYLPQSVLVSVMIFMIFLVMLYSLSKDLCQYSGDLLNGKLITSIPLIVICNRWKPWDYHICFCYPCYLICKHLDAGYTWLGF